VVLGVADAAPATLLCASQAKSAITATTMAMAAAALNRGDAGVLFCTGPSLIGIGTSTLAARPSPADNHDSQAMFSGT